MKRINVERHRPTQVKVSEIPLEDRILHSFLRENAGDWTSLGLCIYQVGMKIDAATDARSVVLKMLSRALRDGYVLVGDLIDGEGFRPWSRDIETSLRYIERAWPSGTIPGFNAFQRVCWFSNTTNGDAFASKSISSLLAGTQTDKH